ncbi:hypothetical protein PHYSODRAFT_533759 [Phytophthora sojae]|uniref:Uncharacterized protein n=1 Tax=Phytophthora sojae (strain P6497) TaxID=1094619 RepID=G5AG18_PHYSP|nr:hypothetical protein PHYSODRAFT_533759 [Phytophthora sojae]EGZ05530.1 hypothetical protein PHYSODRAFT_533759 [Phytophthora sojae]|eukprot:XP_009539061.1 hypothetical protein PHYSODRAFT_533759 [Phytophthora sojae]
MNSGVQCPRRAFRQPSPHSGSSRKRTDSSRTMLVIGSALIGGICRKSPTSTMCTSPNGTQSTCMYRRNKWSSFSHSVLFIMEISSTTSRSSGANCFSLVACSRRMRKLASVRPLMSPLQNKSTALMTRLFPVPPAPPRNMSSWSSRSRSV